MNALCYLILLYVLILFMSPIYFYCRYSRSIIKCKTIRFIGVRPRSANGAERVTGTVGERGAAIYYGK